MRHGRKTAAGREPTSGSRPPTMMDVAAAAGVSQTTVSLVLNNIVEARLSASTRNRVRDAARVLGYTLPGHAPARVAGVGATAVGFVADEITTDPWCAMQLEAVRAKAWEHGLTVTAGVTHGDPELEAAILERMLRRAAGRIDLRLGADPSDPPARGLRPHADRAPQLLRARPQPRLGGPGRAARRLRRDAAPDPRRPPPDRPRPRPVLDRPGARPHPRLPPGASRARHPLRPGAGPARQLGAADRVPAHGGADGPARPADGDLPLERHDGGRRLRRLAGSAGCAFRRTCRWSATTTARSPSSCARR